MLTERQPAVDRLRAFDARDKTVTMRIATSLISVEQAKHNLELEIAPTRHVRDASRTRAQRRVGRASSACVEVEGATDGPADHAVLEPLPAVPVSELGVREHRHATTRRVYKHAVQSSTVDRPPSTPTQTGAPVVDGKVYVNNGFWDTYRTTWPAYSLLHAEDGRRAGRRLRPAVPRRRLDRALVVAGLRQPDDRHQLRRRVRRRLRQGRRRASTRTDAYDAALKNATVAPPGRPDDPTSAARAWSGRSSSATRRRDVPARASRGRSRATSTTSASPTWPRRWPTSRRPDRAGATARSPSTSATARSDYVNMFDPAIGFFQGRDAAGALEVARRRTTTRASGATSTTTPRPTAGTSRSTRRRTARAWPTSTAAGPALADEARQVLRHARDGQRSPAPTAASIHEMIEARDVRMGQWGFCNQVSHHIPYMYDYAGQPYKTQAKVREALRRLYVGSEIGQGYAGRRGQRRDVGLVPVQRARLLPAAGGQPELRDRLAAVHARRRCTSRTGKKLVVNAPRQQRRQRLRAGR